MGVRRNHPTAKLPSVSSSRLWWRG